MSEFSEPAYRQIISSFVSAGYTTVGFDSPRPQARQFILRHDIDFSLEHATRQAEINAELGVQATFFFLATTEHYNLFGAAGRQCLRSMKANGQWIGIHLDVADYDAGMDIDKIAKHELMLFAAILGGSPAAISFHRPVPALLGRSGTLAGLPHAYEPRFISDVDYCSDSNGAFHHGHPLEREAFRLGKPMQLLTHPIWWMDLPAGAPLSRLDHLLHRKQAALQQSFARNCKLYAAHHNEVTEVGPST
ncbi:MAG: hypothetical protein IPM06_02825 [Rhizobiales bacterium]|nr:hypothetical protein [Hyphomicrobiales bacterium]